MIRSGQFLRSMSRLALVLPLAAIGCSNGSDAADPAGAGGIGGSGGTGGNGGSGAGAGGVAGTGGTAAADITPPTVNFTAPADSETGVSSAAAVTATFSEALAEATVTATSFRLTYGDVVVPGVVTYFNRTATLRPVTDLALSTAYTATISTDVTDVAGNALAQEYSFLFTTDASAPLGPKPVFLGAAGKYVMLAKAAISNVPTSVITGDVGLSPAAASYITGFSMTRVGTHWTSPQVVGSLFAADSDPPTPNDLTVAVGDMQNAYTDAAGRPTPTSLNLGGGNIGGVTLAPGLYRWESSVTIPTDVMITGAPNDVWVFQITGDLKSSTATNMVLSGGAQASNIFWQVAGEVILGTDSHAEGIILSKTAVNLGTGASLNGRLMAQTAVAVASATVTAP